MMLILTAREILYTGPLSPQARIQGVCVGGGGVTPPALDHQFLFQQTF